VADTLRPQTNNWLASGCPSRSSGVSAILRKPSHSLGARFQQRISINSCNMTDQPPTIHVEDGSPALQGERVAFTGILASMTHDTAHAQSERHGGVPTHSVSRKTTLLVIGEEGWPIEIDGKPSQKFVQVEEWNAAGDSIRIINESEWLSLIGLREPADETHRSYTPAMLSSLLSVPVGLIRRWERTGLIKAVRRVHRLPYFDYEEVISVRRLTELIDNGAKPAEIERSLTRLGKLLGNSDRSLAQLNLLVRDQQVVVRDAAGLIQPRTGQRLMDFDPPEIDTSVTAEPALETILIVTEDANDDRVSWSAEEWFCEGCRVADSHQLQDAIEAFRLSLTAEPFRTDDQIGSGSHPAEVNFHLADTLYRAGKTEAAIERYYCCIEHDANYLEAWTQLGCLLAEANALKESVESFRIALDLHPQYADAHWHLANVLKQQGLNTEAEQHWRTYLDFDQYGPWADGARQALGLGQPSI
jgi:tetratricopeptide (TPR) repeat protein